MDGQNVLVKSRPLVINFFDENHKIWNFRVIKFIIHRNVGISAGNTVWPMVR